MPTQSSPTISNTPRWVRSSHSRREAPTCAQNLVWASRSRGLPQTGLLSVARRGHSRVLWRHCRTHGPIRLLVTDYRAHRNGQDRLNTLIGNVVLLEDSKNVILAVLLAVAIVAIALAVLLVLNGQQWW